MKKQILIAGLVATGLVAAVLAYGAVTNTDTTPPSSTQTPTSQPTAPAKSVPTDETQLLYLIEEEKLAYDVYTAMYERYGAKVFQNIASSEATHQNRVLTLLKTRDITDPRSAEPGVFADDKLQDLYDNLISRGNESLTEAYRVGVLIEEKDIADLTTQLEQTADDDIVATLTALRSASQNHLRAFQRQL